MNPTDQDQNSNVNRSFVVDFSQPESSANPFDAIKVKEQPSVEEAIVETNDQVDDTPEEDTTDTDTQESNEELDSQGDTSEESDVDNIEGDTDDAKDDSEEEESDVNPYFYLQQQLKSEGFIDEEAEFGEDVDGMSVYSAYKDKLKKDLEPAIRQEVLGEMAQLGFNESDLVMARAIRQGIDPQLLSEVGAYEHYATISDDSEDDTKIGAIRAMYQTKGLQDEEITNLIQAAQDNETVDKWFKTSKEFFTGRYNQFVEQQNALQAQQQQQQLEQVQKANELIRNVIDSREVFGEKFSDAQAKEFEDAILKQTEVVEVQGNRYHASEMQKFLLEFETNPEMKLYMFKKWKFRDVDKEQIKAEVEKKVEKEFLSGYETKMIKKKSKGSKNQKIKQKLEENKSVNKSYFIN